MSSKGYWVINLPGPSLTSKPFTSHTTSRAEHMCIIFCVTLLIFNHSGCSAELILYAEYMYIIHSLENALMYTPGALCTFVGCLVIRSKLCKHSILWLNHVEGATILFLHPVRSYECDSFCIQAAICVLRFFINY